MMCSNIEKLIEKLQGGNREWEKAFSELMSFQNAGIELERDGRLEEAVRQYKQAVKLGENDERFKVNNYFYSIERLVIVCRKLKKYDDEIRVINLALSSDLSDSDRKKMSARLEKAIKLKDKI